MQKWGICATIKAPVNDILRFAAYHFDKGAHRIFIYLDDNNQAAFDLLKTHPKIRVTMCDATWWKRLGEPRPDKHQVRQSLNATHAYHRRVEVDWLIHMDVDEFLVSEIAVDALLDAVPNDTALIRIRPMEALSGGISAFKRFIPKITDRERITNAIYPKYGRYTKGGFLSHLAGKVFVRTGLPDVTIQIHNAFQDGQEIKGINNQPGLDLAHLHAKSWEDWQASYRFRLTKGSYRDSLGPNKAVQDGGLTMHQLFTMIEDDGGTTGLRAFFDEVCADTPALRARLDAHGVLTLANLDLDTPLSTHFPSVIP